MPEKGRLTASASAEQFGEATYGDTASGQGCVERCNPGCQACDLALGRGEWDQFRKVLFEGGEGGSHE